MVSHRDNLFFLLHMQILPLPYLKNNKIAVSDCSEYLCGPATVRCVCP